MKLRRGMAVALALVLSQLLSACANSKPPVVVRIATPPADKLVCADEPRVPLSLTDAAVAGYIAALASAGADCRSRLAYVREWAVRVR